MSNNKPLTIGVEEEYQLVDPRTGQLVPNCKQVMTELHGSVKADVQHELHLSQIEMASPICQTLKDVREQVTNVRGRLAVAAERSGSALVAAGTNPMPYITGPTVTPTERYQHMTQRYEQLARDLLIFGCHVHVSMPSRDVGLQVMNRSRRFLPILQAISANSPYWHGVDTGYASYRRELWIQWPVAGPPPHFDNLDDYHQAIGRLLQSEAISDETKIYWDIRLPVKLPTIEYRVMDTMTEISHVVAVVGLIRALVQTIIRDIEASVPAPKVDASVLRAAMWQAARYGMTGHLIDPEICRTVAAADFLKTTIDYVRGELEENGDAEEVLPVLQGIAASGSGAERQREHGGSEKDPTQVARALIDSMYRVCV